MPLDERDRLLREHLPLVRRIAYRYRGFGLPVDDLMQEGAIGLLEAAERFDPARGRDFERFARVRIKGAIRNALTERGRLVRLPKHVVERRRALERAAAVAAASTGAAPSEAELAEATGLDVNLVHDARTASVEVVPLDHALTNEPRSIADPAAVDPERAVVERDRERAVDDAVAHLPERERIVIQRAFGFDGEERPIAAVAEELHLSPQRTRAIELTALRRLRDHLETSSVVGVIAGFFLNG
ncbi:MAG TPA: sigma-70 family RNA polymerase sigma factor [Gaiellaceae bacterium]|nr:sigma-70 family RNA polymerase sigma factor [Gaiellaceae bacterium]